MILTCIIAFLFSACSDRPENTNKDITIEAFSDLRTPVFSLRNSEIRHQVESICYSFKPEFAGDRFANNYYLAGGDYLWIDRSGVDGCADTLLSVLRTVADVGFDERSFFVDAIESDLEKVRNLEFDDSVNIISHVFARLEYNLTRACMRYYIGMRYGFVNPTYLFNHLDTLDDSSDSATPRFEKLFDIDIEHPGKKDVEHVLNSIRGHELGMLFDKIEPDSYLYSQLKKQLALASGSARNTVICNMERCRWRMADGLQDVNKRVIVNIPAFHLYAYGEGKAIDMRIGCGTRKTKTPLLSSCINRMDVNPVWNIPMSIIRKDIAPRATDTAYFARNRYYVVERKTGERVAQSDVTTSMLESGDYRVVQEGGEGNSLGRIIFRFPNDFSVFLHDTSSKGVFTRNIRSVSHGCVRVQEPFALAEFLLGDVDEWQLDKLRISMGIPPTTLRGQRYVDDSDGEAPSLVRSLKVEPCVPLYIVYYTMFADTDGRLCTYNDIYGFDDVIFNNIKPLVVPGVKK